MTIPRHLDFDRYVEACNYPGVLDPGFYEFQLARELDPFAEQARRIAD